MIGDAYKKENAIPFFFVWMASKHDRMIKRMTSQCLGRGGVSWIGDRKWNRGRYVDIKKIHKILSKFRENSQHIYVAVIKQG